MKVYFSRQIYQPDSKTQSAEFLLMVPASAVPCFFYQPKSFVQSEMAFFLPHLNLILCMVPKGTKKCILCTCCIVSKPGLLCVICVCTELCMSNSMKCVFGLAQNSLLFSVTVHTAPAHNMIWGKQKPTSALTNLM